MLSKNVTCDLVTGVKVTVTVKKTSISMAWTTSNLNGATKWRGPGHPEYAAAAAILGSEVGVTS